MNLVSHTSPVEMSCNVAFFRYRSCSDLFLTKIDTNCQNGGIFWYSVLSPYVSAYGVCVRDFDFKKCLIKFSTLCKNLSKSRGEFWITEESSSKAWVRSGRTMTLPLFVWGVKKSKIGMFWYRLLISKN